MDKNKLLWMYPLGFLGLIVFTIYDLNISISLYNDQQVFSRFFEFLGGLPSVIVCGVSCLILYKTSEFEKRSSAIFHKIFMFIIFVLNIIIGANLFRRYIGLGYMGFFIIGLGLIAVSILIYRFLSFDNREKMQSIARFGLIYFFLVLISFNLVKMTWARERFRNMLGNYNNFSPWYIRQGFTIDNAFMSFPSGHTANASTIVWFSLFPKLEDKKWFKVFSSFWILSVMYSRIVLGAHFASDVTVGALLSLSIFLILHRFFYRKTKT